MSQSNHVAQGTRIPPPQEAVLCALVIDDDEPIAESIAAFVRTHGYEAAHATSGQEGLALAWQRRPLIVFCDLAMPGTDGYQVAELLRSDRSYRPFLVALGDRAGEAQEQRARQAGFDRYIAKPVDAYHLLPLVQTACGEATMPGSG
jgi:CheY-like chemotaxis protein